MNRISKTLLTVVTGLAALCASGATLAGNVGYFGDKCYGDNSAGIIAAAGHTPVALSTLTAGSLAGLQALFIDGCSFATSDAVNTAVNNGLVLIWHDPNWSGPATKQLPGIAGVPYISGGDSTAVDFPVGSPVLTGPGGSLNNGSLDNGSSSSHGYFDQASLPVGATVLANQGMATRIVSFSYVYGAGRVVYSSMPLTCYFPGSSCDGSVATAGMQAYAKNVIAWAVGPQFTTCAAEGFSGTKLTLCRQVCEMHYTGTKLNALIRTWTSLYHEDPPCAR
jgi:hypothetical protein